MVRLPYTQISKDVLPPRISVLGYVKVGGLQDRVLFSRKGRPWVPPVRYVNPARFEITTREQRIEELKGQGEARNETFKVNRGYVRDARIHALPSIGENPSEIDVRFMFPTAAQNLISHFGAHNGSKWICQGNGLEAQDLTRGTVPCPCSRLKQWDGEFDPKAYPELQGHKPEYRTEKYLTPCKPRGVLSMILPDAATFGGFHVFKTTSWESIANLRTQLELFEAQFGRVDGLPFRLKVYPATKGYGEGEGTTTQPIVTLVIAASFDHARQLGAAAAEESRRFLLAAGGDPDPESLRRELEKEMGEEEEREGAEFHSRGEPDGPTTEGASMEDRLRAKRAALPVVPTAPSPAAAASAAPAPGGAAPPPPPQPAQESAPDFEVVGEDEPETGEEVERMEPAAAAPPAWRAPDAASACRPGLEESHRVYVAALHEVVPHWTNEQLVAWQTEKVKKASTRTWEALDFDLASVFLRRGDIGTQAAAAGAPQGTMF